MADTRDADFFPTGATAAEAERRAVLRLIERVLRGEEPRVAEAQESALAEISGNLFPALSAAEQAIVETWDAADVDNRLDALLARLADTEARLDRQLARLDAEGG